MAIRRHTQRSTVSISNRVNSANLAIIRSYTRIGANIFTVTSGTPPFGVFIDNYFHAVFTSTAVIQPVSNITAEYVIVAGGGGGGGWGGGGGGAGGLLFGSTTLYTGISYTFTVGAGGTGATVSVYVDAGKTNGSNTIISGGAINLVAVGGGRGKGHDQSVSLSNGGSGGGTATLSSISGSGYGYPGTIGNTQQGYPGGTFSLSYAGAGGGGAGQAGSDVNGNAGNGYVVSWLSPPSYSTPAPIGQVYTGNTYLAGGGGAGAFQSTPGGTGGLGGGGRSGTPTNAGFNGNTYTGGGGGAAHTGSPAGTNHTGGGSGGSGVIIIRWIED